MKLSQRLATEFSAPHLQTALYRAGKAKSPFRTSPSRFCSLIIQHRAISARGAADAFVRPPLTSILDFDFDFDSGRARLQSCRKQRQRIPASAASMKDLNNHDPRRKHLTVRTRSAGELHEQNAPLQSVGDLIGHDKFGPDKSNGIHFG
jgi:hypothetical protein